MKEGNADDMMQSIEISEAWFKEHIYEIRGQKVMLDSDLAKVYGYTTKRFNEQVRNNIGKFEFDFMFELTEEEYKNLRTNFSTANISSKSRYRPHVFTEQGVYMLMTILHGELASRQTKTLIRLFALMKNYITETGQVNQLFDYHKAIQIDSAHIRINKIENRLDKIESSMITKEDYQNLFIDYFEKTEVEDLIIWKGEWFKADLAYGEIYEKAKHTIDIIDDYIDIKTLHGLTNVRNDVEITIYANNTKQLPKELFDDFVLQDNKKIKIMKTEKNEIHDRFIFIDRDNEKKRKVYSTGSSVKDTGKSISLIDEKGPVIFMVLDHVLDKHREDQPIYANRI